MHGERSMEDLVRERAHRLVDVQQKIDDVRDMIAKYKKQPSMPELDIVIEKLQTELAELEQQEAELTK